MWVTNKRANKTIKTMNIYLFNCLWLAKMNLQSYKNKTKKRRNDLKRDK